MVKKKGIHISRKKMQKRLKYNNKIEHKVAKTIYGDYGIVAMESSIIKANHIETIRIISNRVIKKLGGRIYIRVKPNKSTSKKSLGVRMGKGKGAFNELIYYTKTNQLLFEFSNIKFDIFLTVYRKIKNKIPMKIGISQ